MPDHDPPARHGEHARHCPASPPPELLRPGSAVLSGGTVMFTASPGMRVRTTPCLTCGQAIGGAPFTVHALILPVPCPNCGGHLAATSALAHAACPPLDDQELATRLAALMGPPPAVAW